MVRHATHSVTWAFPFASQPGVCLRVGVAAGWDLVAFPPESLCSDHQVWVWLVGLENPPTCRTAVPWLGAETHLESTAPAAQTMS